MKQLAQFIVYGIGIVGIFFLHAVFTTIAPFPFNGFNSIFFFLICFMVYNNTPRKLWLVVPLSLLLEIFSSTPFGVQTVALFTSLTIVNFLLTNFFTNRSLYNVFLVGAAGLATFHFVFRATLFLYSLVTRTSFILPPQLLLSLGNEILCTSLALALVYALTARRLKRLNPRYLSSS